MFTARLIGPGGTRLSSLSFTVCLNEATESAVDFSDSSFLGSSFLGVAFLGVAFLGVVFEVVVVLPARSIVVVEVDPGLSSPCATAGMF